MRKSTVFPSQTAQDGSKPAILEWLGWTIIILLLLLRVGLFGWYPVLAQDRLEWIEPAYQISTYALTALFLYANRRWLGDYHFDVLAVLIFIIFKPLQTLLIPVLSGGSSTVLAFPHPTALVIWAIALILLTAMFPTLRQMPKPEGSNWRWLLAGCLTGPLLAFMFAFLLIPWSNIGPVTPIYDISLLLAFPYQIAYAGIDEEPLFRGLVWGQLRRNGWREGTVLIFQAAVFMLAHARLLTDVANLPFAISVFIGGIVFGLLALRSRSVATSMLAHGFYNASTIFAYYLIAALFR